MGGGVGVGQELEESLDATEGGAEVVEGIGVGFAAGGAESFAQGCGLVGEGWFVRVWGGVGHRDLVMLLDADLVEVSSGAGRLPCRRASGEGLVGLVEGGADFGDVGAVGADGFVELVAGDA